MAFFMLETLKSSETTLKTTLTSSIKTKTDGWRTAFNRQLQRLRASLYESGYRDLAWFLFPL